MPKSVHFKTPVKVQNPLNKLPIKPPQERNSIVATSNPGNNHSTRKGNHCLYRNRKIQSDKSKEPRSICKNENSKIIGAPSTERDPLDPLNLEIFPSNKSHGNQENRFCGYRPIAESEKIGNVTSSPSENYSSYGYEDTSGPFTTAFEETDNLATQEFEEASDDIHQNQNNWYSNEYNFRNEEVADRYDSRYPEGPFGKYCQENDSESSIGMLNGVNNYEDILENQEPNQKLFEEKMYANWPQEDEDTIDCIRQIDTDNADPILCNSN